MKIVIDITENAYEAYKEWTISGVATVEQMVIARGTPVQTGEWMLHGMIYYCSNCGRECGESGDNFCGNCGAKMEA